MIDWLFHLVWTAIPLWVWIIAAGIALGAAWRTFGWQGVVGGLIALVTLGVYRQGYRDAAGRRPPLVPIEEHEREIATPPPRERRTLIDILNGR